MQSSTLAKRLLLSVAPYWRVALLSILATAAYATTDPILVRLMQPLIDKGIALKDTQEIYQILIWLVVLTVLRAICFFVGNVASRWVSSQVVFDLRFAMFKKLHQLPHRYYDHHNSGAMLSRFNYDVLQLTQAATSTVITVVKDGMTVIALLGFLFYQNWRLTLMILVIAPLVGLIVRQVSKRLRGLAEKIQGDMGYLNHVLDENIKGQKVVKIYHGERHETAKFYLAAQGVRRASIKSEVVSALTTPSIEFIIMIVLVLIILFSAHSTENNTQTIGGFVTYIAMMAMLFSPVKKLTRINEQLQRGLAASNSLFSFLDTEVEEVNTPRLSLDQCAGDLVFEQVSFAYETETVLADFNLHIRAGESIGIVGASGSGKSSLAALLPRFYEINSGSIRLDGIDLSTWNLEQLREQISFINQDIVLFEGNVYDNIAYGVPADEVNKDRVYQAADIAFAREFIDTLADGFYSQIGESGSRLSGGQRQRIAIARAVYKNAPIFILDEATSALDNDSEQKVHQALQTLIQDKTAIIIAHRLSTVRYTDRIVVLSQGQIVEMGSHNELLAQQGVYSQLYRDNPI